MVTADERPEQLWPGPNDSDTAGKWVAVLLLFVAVLVNYIDRSNLSIAAVPMMKDFRISRPRWGLCSRIFLDLLADADSGRISRRLVRCEVGVCRCFLAVVVGVRVGWSRSDFPSGSPPASRSGFCRNRRPSCEHWLHPAELQGSEQGLPTSIYLAGMQLGPALGGFVGALLLQQHGWRWLF